MVAEQSFFTYFFFIHYSFFLSGNAVLQLHADVFTFLQHCCYVVVCRFVRCLMAFVCQEIKGLLTYLLYKTHQAQTSSYGGPST